MAGEVHVGIDLAWSTGTTGLTAVDDFERLLTSTTVRGDDEIASWLNQQPIDRRPWAGHAEG